ncbi:MAG: hypothetical protein HY796_03455 [Elusimicrobia bacterium]|nr:hypothetical protein [Elusimicrobiota bacterium]
MKRLTAVFLMSLPASAHAMSMRGGAGNCDSAIGGLMAAALYAAVAALGYWTLQHADKEAHNCVRRTGMTVGGLLVVVGLLGFLCGVAGHVRTAASSKTCGGGHGYAGMMGEMPMLPPGPPPAGMLREIQTRQAGQQSAEKVKKPEAGAKKDQFSP